MEIKASKRFDKLDFELWIVKVLANSESMVYSIELVVTSLLNSWLLISLCRFDKRDVMSFVGVVKS